MEKDIFDSDKDESAPEGTRDVFDGGAHLSCGPSEGAAIQVTVEECLSTEDATRELKWDEASVRGFKQPYTGWSSPNRRKKRALLRQARDKTGTATLESLGWFVKAESEFSQSPPNLCDCQLLLQILRFVTNASSMLQLQTVLSAPYLS